MSKTKVTVPPRSLLFSLDAIGVGSAKVEAFTSYVMRLAREHDLSVVDTAAIAMTSDRNPSPAVRPTLAWSVALNGASVRGERWVTAFEDATNSYNLRFLTLQPLQSAFAQGVLSFNRKWCSSCLEKWRSKRMTVYEPLLWNFRMVRVCPVHSRLLETFCPHCKRKNAILGAHSLPGFCQHCCCWLATTTENPEEQIISKSFEQAVSNAVCGLLELLPTVDPERVRQTVIANISLCIQRIADGNFNAFMKYLPDINQSILREGLAGRQLLQLQMLIRISIGLEIPLARFFNPSTFSEDDFAMMTKSTVTVGRIGSAVRGRAGEIKEALGACTSGLERPSLQQIAYQLGYASPYMLLKADRNLCKVVNKRYAESHRHENESEHSSRIRHNLILYKRALQDAVGTAKPFSPYGIARNFGFSGSKVGCIFPSLWRDVVLKAKENKRKRGTEIRQKIEEVLTEGSAPSVNAVARRVGCSPEFLREREPELRRKISERYQRNQVNRLKGIRKEVTRSLVEHPPPTSTEVCRRLGISNQSLSRGFPELQEKLIRRHREWVQGNIQSRIKAVSQEAYEIALRLHRPGVVTPKHQIRRLMSPRQVPNWNILNVILGEARDSAAAVR